MKTNKKDQGELEVQVEISDEVKADLEKLADILLEGFMELNEREYLNREEEK